MPQDYQEIYLCDLLQITYTELSKQPADWVEKMILWHTQKTKAEEVNRKAEERRSKAK